MAELFSLLEAFLSADEWPIGRLDDQPIIRTGFRGDHGEFTCFAQAREEQQQVIVYSIFPAKVPPDRIQEVGEFILRANYGMMIGNFEIDLADGEVRYKTSVDLEGVDAQEPILRNLVYANVLTMDKYFPGLMRVIYAGITAEEAVQEIES
jgi:hypothetical protein